MNDYLISVLLGIVEGLTEFLPISSTAHLRIVEALLHLDLHDSFWKMYTIVIQLGAILALPVYFRGTIAKFLSTFPQGSTGDRTVFTHPLSLTLIAFVITAIPAWVLKKQIGQNLESLTVMAWALLLGGVIMWIVDAVFTRPRTAQHGRNEFAAGGVDRRGADTFRGVSGHFALHVHDRGGTNRGIVASGGARVFVFPVDADDGRRDRLRFA